MPTSPTPTPDGEPIPTVLPMAVIEDVEDLKAKVQALTTQLKALREERNADAEETADTGADASAPSEQDQEEEEWQYPPFILLLEGDAYDAELRALIEWVEGVLVKGYLAEPSADAHWCHRWFDHPVAIARLHALWLAWQELTDPTSCGYTGPSVWHRDHYDPCIRELRAANGPFQGCTKGEHQTTHRMPGLVPSAWYQDDDQ